MARKLDIDDVRLARFRSAAHYPWDEWLDGNAWELKKGVDFTSSARGMRAYIYEKARHRGTTASVSIRDNGETILLKANR